MLFSRNCLVNGAPGIAVFSRAVARTESLKPSTRLCTAYRPIDGINLHNVYMRKCVFHNALRYCCYLYPMISKETGRIHAAFVRDAIKILDRIFVVRWKRDCLMTSTYIRRTFNEPGKHINGIAISALCRLTVSLNAHGMYLSTGSYCALIFIYKFFSGG